MSINRWLIVSLMALTTFTLRAADVNYTKSINADDNWWTPASWSGATWANSIPGSDSKATLNVGAVNPTIQVINTAVPANSAVELADLTIKGSNGAFAIAGSNMTFTSAAPYIDITGMKDASSVLNIRNVLSSENPIEIRSVGTAPGGAGFTGGIRFEKAPNLGTIRMKSGHLLLLDAAAANAFTDTVILDGGGICSQNNNHFYGFPLKIGAAGGWWRTYGSANMIFDGLLSDEAPGITGTFKHSDGGTMTITNTLVGFSGTLRNEGGTLKIGGAALDFSGEKVSLGASFSLGNNDTVTDYTFDIPIEGTAGTLIVDLASGTVKLPNEIKIQNYLDKKGTSTLELVGERARTSAAGGLAIYGGTVEMKAGSFTGTGELSLKEGSTMWMTGGTATFGNRMETQNKAAFLQNGGELTVLQMDMGNGTNTINGGVLRAGYLNMVNYGDGRFSLFVQNGGNVSLTTTNTTIESRFRIGHWGSGKGTLVLNNGEFNAENLNMIISWDSPGQVDVNNGVFKAHTITVGEPTRSNQADLNLHGGTLVVGAGGIVRRANKTTMNFTGGTIASAAPFTISGPLTLGDSIDDTVIFDASNSVITAIGAITGAGTLVKRGAEKFVFSDLQTALQVDAGKVEPTYYAVSLPEISSTSAGATFDVKLASTAAGTSTKYTAVGDINLADGTVFDVTLYQGSFESGVAYTLMESTGGTITINGALVAPLFDSSRSSAVFALSPDNKKLLLSITDTPTSVYWKNSGAAGDWNLDDVNWSQNPSATTPDEAFQSLDSVVFNDITGQSSVTVTITPETVVPRSMVVGNSATEYQINGTGIYGGTSLTKSGAGTLKIGAPWLSSGAIAITGGTLDWQNSALLSGAKLSVSSGATFKQNSPDSVVTASGAALWNGANLVLNAGTFNVAAGSNLDPLSSLTIKDGILRSAAENMSKPFTVTGTSGGVDFRQLGTGVNNGISGKISGAGNLTVYGNGGTADGGGGGGSTKLSNSANDFIGDVILASGVIDAESGFGNADNAIVLNGGGTLRRKDPITINRDLLVGPNGGVLRCYGSLNHQQIWTKRFADWSEGVSGGTVSTIDGGTFQFTGDVSGFTGNFRKPRGRLVVGNGGALPCDHMRWNSLYLEGERAAFNFSNSDFKVGFTTSGTGQFYKQGTGDLVWTNSVGLAHTGGTFIEGGTLKVQEPNQFADGSTVTISQGAVLERLNTSALGTTGTRKIAGAGTFKLTIATECGGGIFSGSSAFNGRLDLNCIGTAKLINITTNQFGNNATIRVNTGALWYLTNNNTYPYKIEIAGIGNSEVSSGFGALRLEMDPTLSGAVTLIDDARIFGGATINGPVSNGCAEPKTLTFGGAYAQSKTLNLNGGVVNGVAPLNLAFTHNNTYNFSASNSVAAVANNNSTLNIKPDAQFWLSESSSGNGTWKFENNAVLGIVVNGETAGSLNAAALTWNAGAKLGVTGLESATKMRIPVIKCPSASISGLPQLAAPLTQGWSLVRSENGGIATIDAVRANGTVIILR